MTEKSKKDWKKVRENETNDDSLLDDEVDDEKNESALEHPSYEELEEKLTLSEQKAYENWEKSVRVLAELENVRRRSEREVANAHRYGLEKFVTSLLPMVDSLEQALQLADKNADKSMHEGLALTLKLCLDVFEKYDVQPLDPVGELFDPQQHEAISMQATSDAAPHTILMVVQKGYQLNDRVIRPARVVVAKEQE